MKVNSDDLPVTNMEEVMEQFLGDSHAQAIEEDSQQETRRLKLPMIEEIMPGIEGEQLESMKRWHGHVVKFLKYRSQVSEKCERQMELRMNRKQSNADAADNADWELDSDDDLSTSEQGEAQAGVTHEQSGRGDMGAAARGGARSPSLRVHPPREGLSPTESARIDPNKRGSVLPVPSPSSRPRPSKSVPLSAAGLILLQKAKRGRKSSASDKELLPPLAEAASDASEPLSASRRGSARRVSVLTPAPTGLTARRPSILPKPRP